MKLTLPLARSGAAFLVCLGLHFAGPSAWADDTLYLKSGDSFQGSVLEDTAAGVKFQVRTGTIKETKFFPRDQVDRIEQPKPDDLAFKDLQAKLPTPSLLDVEGYRKLLDGTDRFLRDFPDSPHRAAVQKIAEELKAECDKVAGGALKVNGNWISAEERKAHQENIDADIMLARIVQLGRNGAYLQALRGLDALKAQYPKTRAYANSTGVAAEVMKAYGRSLTQALADRKAAEAALAERKARLTPVELDAYNNELAVRQQQLEALNQRERAAGAKWLSVNTESVEGLQEGIEFVRKQLASLQSVKVEDLKADANALYEAETLIGQGQVEAAEAKLREALRSKSKLLVSRDAHVSRVLRDLNAAKEERTRSAKLAAADAGPSAGLGKPMVTAGDGKAASADDVLGDMTAIRSAKAPADAAKAGAGKAKQEPASKAKAAKARPSSHEADADDESGSDGRKARPRPTMTADADSGGSMSFTLIMGLVAAVLISATVGFYFFDKQRKAKAAAGGSGEE